MHTVAVDLHQIGRQDVFLAGCKDDSRPQEALLLLKVSEEVSCRVEGRQNDIHRRVIQNVYKRARPIDIADCEWRSTGLVIGQARVDHQAPRPSEHSPTCISDAVNCHDQVESGRVCGWDCERQAGFAPGIDEDAIGV